MNIFRKILKEVVFVIEKITNTTITIRHGSRIKIRVHPDAVSNGGSMQYYVNLVEKFCTFKPQNVFEIGANYAQDAEYLRQRFCIDETDVYIFEPHPQIIAEVKKMYKFNAIDLAVSNVNGKTVFHAIDVKGNEYQNSGISSLRDGLTTNKSNFIDVDVELIRMDNFMSINKIRSIDFLKLDVEGMNYEVLEGFGERLSDVKIIQTEGEYLQYWEGQKLYADIEELLLKHDFKLVSFILSEDGVQSDSFWIQERYLKKPELV